MQTIKKLATSRTAWTIAVLFLINGINGIHDSIPAGLVTSVDAILSILAAYFHANPSQAYNPQQ